MARKREDKNSNKDGKKTQKEQRANNSHQNKNYNSLEQQLAVMKLTLREIPGDGNCLFGALADQIDGTPKTHQKHRQQIVTFMRDHREDFEPFVEDDEPFERHLSGLSELGTYGGNECIVAFARLNQVKVVIHQLNTALWQICGCEEEWWGREVHISYHNGDHYNSVRRIGDSSANPANIRLTVKPSSDLPGSGPSKTEIASAPWLDEAPREYGDEGGPRETLALVMERSGCRDPRAARRYLVANCYDVNDTVDDLLNYIIHEHAGDRSSTACGGVSSDDRFDGLRNGNIPHRCAENSQRSLGDLQTKLKNGSLSSAKRKEIKKQIRKCQSSERKRLASCQGQAGPLSPLADHSMDTIVVQDIGCLSI